MLTTTIVRLAAAKIDRMIAAQLLRKLGIIARVAVQQLRRTRMGGALIKGFQATASSFGRVLHQLWLEVTGFTFLAVAAIGVITGLREYGKYHAGQASGPGRLILAIAFTLCFTWFGLSSFWRVNKSVARHRASRLRSEIR
jgi:hypothetical protein